jgi:hypothetical protein
MADDIKRDLQYFEESSMRELYDELQDWQARHQKRFHSLSIHLDGGRFCCIALTNPSEVVVTSADGSRHAEVSNGRLHVV